MHRKQVFLGVLLCVSIVVALLSPEITNIPRAYAATLTVTTTNDDYGTNNGSCSLREAIRAANTNANYGGCNRAGAGNADVINLQGGATYFLTRNGVDDDNDEGDLDILDAAGLTINGNGATIDRNFFFDDRVIDHIAGATVLNNLTLRDGRAQSNGGALATEAAGSLTLSNVIITGNRANGDGGGLYTLIPTTITNNSQITGNQSTAANQQGGGIYSTNTLTIANSTITNNTTNNGVGAGIYSAGATSSLSLTATTVENNNSGTASGGGIAKLDTALSVTGGVIRNNRAGADGAGIFAGAAVTVTGNATISGNQATGSGGGIFSTGAINITGSNVNGNNRAATGGGIYANNAALTLDNAQVTGNAATAAGGGGGVYANGAITVTMTNSRVDGNTAAGTGGGILLANGADLTVNGGSISTNQSTATFSGGGIFAGANSIVSLAGTTLADNVSANFGGGLAVGGAGSAVSLNASPVTNNAAANGGGGLYVVNGATLQIGGSTFQNNRTTTTGSGGGVFVGDAGNATVTASAFNTNTAVLTGGGIERQGTGTLTVNTTTFQGNRANTSGGGIRISGNSTVTITGSNFQANTANNNAGAILFSAGSSVSITGGTFQGNRADTGSAGAIYATGPGTLSLDTVTFDANVATAGAGGAIYANNQSVTIIRSAVVNNQSGGVGGGIQAAENPPELAVVNITNSTVSSNTAGGAGGGISLSSTGAHIFNNVTITNNTSPVGGGLASLMGTPSVTNTIIATNLGTADTDCSGAFASQGYNVIGSDAGCTGFTNGTNGDQVGTAATPLNPLLGALALNGGATLNHLPQAGSPALNSGNNATCVSPDQIGTARPLPADGPCDAGSIEAPFTNTPPVWTLTPPNQALFVNEVLTLPQSTFTDPDHWQTFTATIDWGDTSPVENGTVVYTTATRNGTVTWPTHVYTAVGVYTATVTVLDGIGNDVETFTVTVYPQAVLSKAFAPGSVVTGQPSTLTFTITNPAGNPALTGLAFTDTLPTDLVLAADVTPAQCGGTVTGTAGTDVIGFSGGTLAAGPSTCTIVVSVESSVPGTYVNNDTNITALSPNLTDTGLTDTLIVNLSATLSKAFAPDTIFMAQTSTLTFTITNPAGNTGLAGLAFTDTLPANVTAVAGTETTTCPAGTFAIGGGGTTVSLTGGQITGGAAATTCTLQVDVTSNVAGVYTNNTANLSGVSANILPTGLTATLTVIQPVTAMSKAFAPATIYATTNSTLTFTISNPAGNPALNGMAFTDTLPTNLTATAVASNSCGGTAAIPGGTAITLTGGTLGAGPATCAIDVTVTSAIPGTYTNNTTNLSGVSANIDPTGLTATLNVLQPIARLAKAFAPATIFTSANSTLTFTITNPAGNPALNAMTFTDTLPANLTATAITGNSCGGTANIPGGTAVTLTGGTIGVGPATCTIDVTVTAAIPNAYANNAANLSGLSVNLNAPGFAATLNVLQPIATLAKAFTPDTIYATNNSTLTFTITNPAGNPALNAMTFTDTLPTNLTATAIVSSCGGAADIPGGTAVTLTGGTLGAGPATCTIDVTVTTATPGTYTNNTTNLSGVSVNLNPIGFNDTLTVVQPLATLAKAFTPPTIFVGNNSTLTFTITNPAGNPALNAMAFTDTLPANLTATALGGNTCGGTAGIPGGTAVTLTNGAIGVGPATCTINVTVTSTVPGSYTNNTANLSGLSVNLNAAGLNATLVVSNVAVLSKAFTPDTILAGNTTTLVFTITNPANAPAQTGMTFTDTLPAGVTALAGTASTTCPGGTTLNISPDGGTLNLTAGQIGADPVNATTCTVQVTATTNTPGVYTNNTANLSGLSVNLVAAGLTATLTANQPFASISNAFAPDTVYATVPTTLTFTINNPAGNPALTGVTFTDTLPAGLVLAADVNAAQCAGTVTGTAGANAIGFSGGALAVGPSSCTIDVSVVSDVPGTYTNDATNLSGLSANIDSTGLTATLTVVQPLATLSKVFAPDAINPGDSSTLTFTITNPAGNPALTGMSFTDQLPLNVAASSVGANTCGGTVNLSAVGGGNFYVEFTGGTIGVGPATCTIDVTVTSAVPGLYTNDTTNLSNVSANLDPAGLTATLTVGEIPVILSETFAPDAIIVGETSTLTFVLTNAALNPTVTGLAFTDTLPAEVVLAEAPPAAQCGGAVTGSAGSNVITLSGGTLGPDEICAIEVTVTSNVPGVYTNDMNNLSGVSALIDPTGLTGTLTVTAMQTTLSKAFNPAAITAGENSTVTFTITNPAGNVAQTGLAFTDELPLNVNAVSVDANTCGGTANLSAVGGGATFVEFSNGTIGAGASTCTIEVTVTSDVPGVYTNNETNLSGVSPNLNTTGLSATLTVEEAATQARLGKAFTPSTIQVSKTASLTFTITNAVGAPAQAGLSFTDTLPAGVTVSGIPAAAQCGGNVSTTAAVITFTGGTLAAGETTCSITVTVTSNTPGVYTNDASNISNLNGLVTGAGITTTLTVTEGPVVPPDDDVEEPTAEDHARAQAPLCSLIGGGVDPVVRADVQSGTVTDGSVFCRILARDRVFILTPAEVGIQSVVDLGVIHAVDVFGLRHDSLSETHFNLGVKVCLEGTGRLLYLDATQSPRPVALLGSNVESGYTCGVIPNAGTVVLVP